MIKPIQLIPCKWFKWALLFTLHEVIAEQSISFQRDHSNEFVGHRYLPLSESLENILDIIFYFIDFFSILSL